MKTLLVFTAIVLALLISLDSPAQVDKFKQEAPYTVIRGDEILEPTNSETININWTPKFLPVRAGDVIFDIHNITDIATGYDLQSNASTQQVWIDANNPGFIHAHFVNSQEATGWSDRNCLYFGSVDGGENWFELGPVPPSGRSGFPALYGNSDGSGVLANHNDFFGGFTRTTISIDAEPFDYNFTNYDPGDLGDGPVWPRLIVDQNDNVVFASSGAPDGLLHINTLNVSTGQFTGWQDVTDGAEAEMYDFSISDNGKIAFAFGGNNANRGDVYVMESTDGGLNWSNPLKIWDADNPGTTPVLGHLRGVQVNYYGEQPCVTFELGQITSTGYFAGLPSEIRFWSENVNGGVPVIVADSSMIPFHPNYGTTDVHFPLARPVIGRATDGYLFIAFSGTTGDYWPGTGPLDSTAYYAGFFSYSADGGETWSEPVKFTPDSPLRDWRYPSIAEIIPSEGLGFTIHIVMQGDSIPGSTVNAAGSMPKGVTAQYYHFSYTLIPPSVEDEINLSKFELHQNYPNPFNPSTKIKYHIPVGGFVTLKVYDVLGNEMTTLVQEEKSAGTHEVQFDANNLSSGVYFYKLQSGSFTQTNKMVLMR
jgi:hypothetical protein